MTTPPAEIDAAIMPTIKAAPTRERPESAMAALPSQSGPHLEAMMAIISATSDSARKCGPNVVHRRRTCISVVAAGWVERRTYGESKHSHCRNDCHHAQ